jgi:hypothetical protein
MLTLSVAKWKHLSACNAVPGWEILRLRLRMTTPSRPRWRFATLAPLADLPHQGGGET